MYVSIYALCTSLRCSFMISESQNKFRLVSNTVPMPNKLKEWKRNAEEKKRTKERLHKRGHDRYHPLRLFSFPEYEFSQSLDVEFEIEHRQCKKHKEPNKQPPKKRPVYEFIPYMTDKRAGFQRRQVGTKTWYFVCIHKRKDCYPCKECIDDEVEEMLNMSESLMNVCESDNE